MKEYNDSLMTDNDEYRISIYSKTNDTGKRVGVLSIDIGCDGFGAELSKKQLQEVKNMISECMKKL